MDASQPVDITYACLALGILHTIQELIIDSQPVDLTIDYQLSNAPE